MSNTTKLTIFGQQTGEVVALKKIPLKKLDDGIPNSVLRYVFFTSLMMCFTLSNSAKGDESTAGV